MAPGAIARVDGDLLAEGGTRLRFEAETLAEAPAPGPSHVAANSRANAWGERARGARLGAALATAAHAAYALADAEDTYGAHAALALLSRASRALASFVSVCANPLTSAITSDPVETFLRRADLLDSTSSGASAAAFRDAGYARAEDFWGITEHELEHVVKVALPAHRRRLVLPPSAESGGVKGGRRRARGGGERRAGAGALRRRCVRERGVPQARRRVRGDRWRDRVVPREDVPGRG